MRHEYNRLILNPYVKTIRGESILHLFTPTVVRKHLIHRIIQPLIINRPIASDTPLALLKIDLAPAQRLKRRLG